MFKLIKFFHFIGLTLFLGSVWVFVASGTPMDSISITRYARDNIFWLISHLTFPGLIIMILTGLAMILIRPRLLRSTFFKIKLALAVLVLIDTRYILSIAKRAAFAAQDLPTQLLKLHYLIHQESFFGAINLAIILFMIGYSVCAKKIISSKDFYAERIIS